MSFQRDLTPFTKIPQSPPKPAFKRATEPYTKIPLNKRGGTIVSSSGDGDWWSKPVNILPFMGPIPIWMVLAGAAVGVILLVRFL